MTAQINAVMVLICRTTVTIDEDVEQLLKDRMSSGSVVFNSRELSVLPEKELSPLRLKNMGFIFSISEQGDKPQHDQQESTGAYGKTEISELADNDITQASGGQLQRVGICRVLINSPDIIFGDEPTGADEGMLKVRQAAILSLFLRKQLIGQVRVNMLKGWKHSGFSIESETRLCRAAHPASRLQAARSLPQQNRS